MNRVILIGRLTDEPKIYAGANGTSARYTLAVERRFKNGNGEQETDFIPCVAFGRGAEFTEKYFHKGMKIAITGRIQTGRYTNKEGKTVFSTDVIVDESEFAESKKANDEPVPPPSANEGFVNMNDMDELPFK